MPDQPDNSVAKFTAGAQPDTADTDETEGTEYSDPDSQGEPAIMLSSAQAESAGMTGAKPGDTFTVKLTVTESTDDGFNVTLDPGSATIEPGAGDMSGRPSEKMGNLKLMGPMDLGMSPTVGNT